MTDEISLDDVYRKFGEVAEAAQLLETELGNLLLFHRAVEVGLLENENQDEAKKIMEYVNRSTLGQLLWQLQGTHDGLDKLDELLSKAKTERNRLSHSFYRHHNFRRNTPEGCSLMFKDLESIHENIVEAYKAIMELSGIDLDKIVLEDMPSGRIPI